jgi:hypothetical protein
MMSEFDYFEWVKNVTITLEEQHNNGGLSVGDVLTLEGEVSNNDDTYTRYFTDLEIEITHINHNNFTSCKFRPLDEELYSFLSSVESDTIYFIKSDKGLVIKKHIKNNQLEESNKKVFQLLKEQDDFR